MTIVNVLACAGFAGGTIGAVRWIGSQSSTLRTVVAVGLLARAVFGLALFWISYLELPVLRSLQLGGGFWTLMVDAMGYYHDAATAVDQGLSTIVPGSGSPVFTKTLAIWMHIVGVSPVAGMFLNLCCYVSSCTLLIRTYRPTGRWRRDLPLLIVIGAMSFSPVLLIDSTQPLKDDVFLLLVIIACTTTMIVFRAMITSAARRNWTLAAALSVLALATYGIAGIRAYYSAILLACLAVGLASLTLASPGRRRRLHQAFTGALVLGVIWFAYWRGAGPYYRPSVEERRLIAETLHWNRGVRAADGTMAAANSAVETARTGFVTSGGSTNIVPTRQPAPAQEGQGRAPEMSPSAVPSSSPSRATLTGLGLAVFVVPISILKAVSLVEFSGGRGLLPVADADTLLMDGSLFALGSVVFRRRHLIRNDRAFVIFGLMLGLVTALLLGYVVTNFGTLFRIRYLASAPFWTLALAVSPRRFADSGLADHLGPDRE
jgi:hypothetical protein